MPGSTLVAGKRVPRCDEELRACKPMSMETRTAHERADTTDESSAEAMTDGEAVHELETSR